MKQRIAYKFFMVIFAVILTVNYDFSLKAQDNREFSLALWSPDGTYLAAISTIGDEYELLLLEFEEVVTINSIHKVQNGYIEDIQWSQDGNFIAYTKVQDGNANIWITRISNNESYNVTEEVEGFSRSPAWSSDSTRLAFVNSSSDVENSRESLSSQIWEIDINTKTAHQLTPDGSCFDEPTWLRDDNVITFVSISCMDDLQGLYLYDFDEDEVIFVTGGSIGSYAFSPDEKRFIIAVLQSNSFLLTDLILLSDGMASELAIGFQTVLDVDWSPDGKQIVVSTGCNYGSTIYRIDIETTELYEVTNCEDGVFNVNPSWSADSLSIVYQSNGQIWAYDTSVNSHKNLTEGL